MAKTSPICFHRTPLVNPNKLYGLRFSKAAVMMAGIRKPNKVLTDCISLNALLYAGFPNSSFMPIILFPVMLVHMGMLSMVPMTIPAIAKAINIKNPAVYEMPFELLSYMN